MQLPVSGNESKLKRDQIKQYETERKNPSNHAKLKVKPARFT